MTLTSAQSARIDQLKASGLLPSPQGPALAVMQLTRQDNVSYTQLAHVVKADPALVARLLKLANTCRAAGSRPLLAIQDAISVLGLTAVRGLALGFALLNDSRTGTCHSFDYPAFWSRNLARAAAMQTLADIARVMPRDEAFTLGLLAHIGELGLACAFPDEYSDLLANTGSSSEVLLAEETQRFGLDHADLTAVLLEDWGIPPLLREPVRCHEKPASASLVGGSRVERICLVLMLASRIADICLAPEAQRRALMAEYFLLGGKLSIAPEMLIDVSDRTVGDWADWCRLLDVPDLPLPPFAELMKASQTPAYVNFDEVPTVVDGDRFRVLVVEDERSMRGLLKALLSHIGHDCLEAQDGRQGLTLALRERPHLMIVDWAMPEMNGIELIRALRETEIGRSIYILILTGLDQEENLVEAFAAGADDFLVKPLKPKVLAARLRAGQRVITLHRELELDQTNLKRFAQEFAGLNQRLQESRRTDLLTGLLSRLPALEWLRQSFDSRSDAESVGVILVRLDSLDRINRTEGRHIGDEVLRRVSTLIQLERSPQERLVRYSGACFLVIVASARNEHLMVRAQRIKQAIAAHVFETGDKRVLVAASVGYAVGLAVAGRMDALLNEVESCLEMGKAP